MHRTTVTLLALFGAALLAVAVVVLPTALTGPFQFHTPAMIEWSYTVHAWGPLITVALLVVGALLAGWVWKVRTSAWAPTVAAIPLCVLMLAAFFSRQPLIEWGMFAPIETIEFEAASSAEHVADNEYVMGVSAGDEARAYPIRMVAYYHIINDEIDGEPFAVTY